MTTTRLIERWLPIAEIGIESVRERTPMTPYPAPNRLHVWWARRPLVASRAAVLASLLPVDVDRAAFLHAIGIHGDPVASRAQVELAKKRGVRFEGEAYGYPRAFTYNPTDDELFVKLPLNSSAVVLDPTAGGGAIPLEAHRMGLNTISNDLNPVATLLQIATIDYPSRFGKALVASFDVLAGLFRSAFNEKFKAYQPQPDAPSEIATNYLYARTVACPYCSGLVPLSPNWKLNPDGVGVRIVADLANGPGEPGRRCDFVIVEAETEQHEGTMSGGNALCPYSDCARTIDGDEIKRQAQRGDLGEQMFAVVAKRRVNRITKSGGTRVAWERFFRKPKQEDESPLISSALADKMPEWNARDFLPSEDIPEGNKTEEPLRYGFRCWTDLFNERQLLAHGFAVETYHELINRRGGSSMSDIDKATFVYLALSIDKMLNWNSRLASWNVKAGTMRSVFDRHDFAFKASYAEMEMLGDGSGHDWALKATSKAIKELVGMTRSKSPQANLFSKASDSNASTIRNGSGSELHSIGDSTVDAIVMDPPYGANVMYAELSDFFYVWLKRTAGVVVPELFTRRLADKEAEAVANKAHFKGQKGAARLADDDYRIKMEGIFAECRRVLKDDGIMTVMFTHKDTGAWDALAMSLMDAGFVITASWPVNTEASGSLHIKDKAAANSTIFLVCRPREEAHGETMYWEDVEPEVARAVRARVGEFQQAGIKGVDLYLASFGPALEAFSRHWPLTRGAPAPEPRKKRRTQSELFEEFDPYAVRPEDALNAARREVKAWRLAQLASAKAQADMDGPTAFYVLAWDAFKAVSFPYDEALRLARAVGVDLDAQIIGRLAEKKAAEIRLWDSATRVAKGAIGPVDGSRGMIDALHHAAHVMRNRGAEAAQEMLAQAGVAKEDEFKVAMEALLEVLPPSKTFSGIDAEKAVKPAADDFDALEKLRRIAYEGEIGEPQQLELYRELMAAE
jgi:adenine-specific DNA methylase